MKYSTALSTVVVVLASHAAVASEHSLRSLNDPQKYVDHYKTRNSYASAYYWSSDDCSYTYFSVWASDSSTKVIPGKPDNWQSNYVYLDFGSYNWCDNFSEYYSGSQEFPGLKNNLVSQGMTINLSMNVCGYNEEGNEECKLSKGTVSWRPTNDSTSNSKSTCKSKSIYSYPGYEEVIEYYHSNSNSNYKSVSAEVTFDVTIGDEVFDLVIDEGYLGTGRYNEIYRTTYKM